MVDQERAKTSSPVTWNQGGSGCGLQGVGEIPHTSKPAVGVPTPWSAIEVAS